MIRSRATWLAVVVAALALAAGCVAIGPLADEPPAEDEPDPEMLFDHAFVYDEDLQDVSGERLTTVEVADERRTELVAVDERPYVEYRSEVLDSSLPDREGDVYASNASTTWWYDATENAATYYEVEEPFDTDAVRDDRAERADDHREQYDLSYEGTGTIADREAHELRAELRNETVERGLSILVGDTEFVYALETVDPGEEFDVVEQRLWIDDEFGYPLKEQWISETPDGERVVYTERFESVSFNVGLADETFTFEPPADASVVDDSGE